MGIWPDANEGLGPAAIDENQLMGIHSDGFSKPEIELTTKGGKHIKYDLPDAIMDSGGPYEIYVPSTGADYLDPSTARVYGEMKIVRIDNNKEVACIEADDFSVINLPANSIFRQIEVIVNGVNVVDNSSSTYHYKSYIESQLSYGYDAKKTILQTAGYYKDHATSCKYNKKEANDTASGYYLRRELVKNSKIWDFGTSLHCDFLDSNRPIPPGVNLVIKFHRNDDNFVLIQNDNKEYKIKLLKLGIEFRKLDYMPAKVSRDLERFSKGEPYIIPFNRTKITTRVIPSGRGSYSISDLYRGPLPQQLIIGFVKHSSFNSDKKSNPYIFENLNIKSLTFKVNGQSFPGSDHRPDFANDKFKREYIHMHDALGVRRLNSGIWINLMDYKTNNCFFVLDLSSDQCNNAHTHITHTGTIGLDIIFERDTAEAFQTIEYGVFHTAMVIDNDRSCQIVDNV